MDLRVITIFPRSLEYEHHYIVSYPRHIKKAKKDEKNSQKFLLPKESWHIVYEISKQIKQISRAENNNNYVLINKLINILLTVANWSLQFLNRIVKKTSSWLVFLLIFYFFYSFFSFLHIIHLGHQSCKRKKQYRSCQRAEKLCGLWQL